MVRRTYQQPDCGLAVALDVLGERWTILILRELLLGPQRYTDLCDALDGLSTNLLTERLRHLEQVGVVCRVDLPPPAASSVYELTTLGIQLEPTLLELARWGCHFTSDARFHPRTAAFAMLMQYDAGQRGRSGITDAGPCRFEIEGHCLTAEIHEGRLATRPHPLGHPKAILSTDAGTYDDLLSGRLELAMAITTGRASILGDQAEIEHILEAVRIA